MFTNPQATIAERLKVALEYRHMTAAELSRKSKISTAALSRYMKGDYQPKQDKIYEMARVLRVSPSWLMGFDTDMETSNDVLAVAGAVATAPIAGVASIIYEKIADVVDKYLPSSEEQKFLEQFRKLTAEQRATILAVMETLETKKAPSEDGEDFSGNRR